MAASTFTAALLDQYTELVSFVLYLGSRPGVVVGADQVATTLEQLLARSRSRAKESGIDENRWMEGLYPVVAWIDEQLLNLDWPGRQAWVGKSLQRKLFQTTLAGRDFFARLDKADEEDLPLREVFDMCLALGFRGQYFHPDDKDRLEEIMRKNMGQMHFDFPLELPKVLFPTNESHLIQSRNRSGFRQDNPFLQALLWLLPILLLLGLYIVLRGSLPTPG